MIFRTAYQKKGYPTIVSKKTVSFSKTITRNIFEKDINFYSSNPTIIEYEDGYLLNLRWINYTYNKDGSLGEWPEVIINLTSRFKLNKDFNTISDEVFLQEELEFPTGKSVGLEDIRTFQMNNEYYYNATCHDYNRQVTAISIGIYNMNDFKLPVQKILPSFYDTQKNKRHEKNWSFVKYKNKMAFVYEWYPLQLTEIDYETNTLNRLVSIPMPDYFKNVRGSTPGYRKGNEIWFVVHKKHPYIIEYNHCFAIFDVDMKLIRYSEWFTIGNNPIEFCLGLIVLDKEVILSYSLLDTQSFVSVYDAESLRRLKWY